MAWDDYLRAVAAVESGTRENVDNPFSGAQGLYQIMPETQRGLQRQGFDLDMSTPAGQTAAASELTRQNARLLRARLGHEPTDDELYFAHGFGGPAATYLLSNPQMPLGTALRTFYGGTRHGEQFADRIFAQNPNLQQLWDRPVQETVQDFGTRLHRGRNRTSRPQPGPAPALPIPPDAGVASDYDPTVTPMPTLIPEAGQQVAQVVPLPPRPPPLAQTPLSPAPGPEITLPTPAEVPSLPGRPGPRVPGSLAPPISSEPGGGLADRLLSLLHRSFPSMAPTPEALERLALMPMPQSPDATTGGIVTVNPPPPVPVAGAAPPTPPPAPPPPRALPEPPQLLTRAPLDLSGLLSATADIQPDATVIGGGGPAAPAVAPSPGLPSGAAPAAVAGAAAVPAIADPDYARVLALIERAANPERPARESSASRGWQDFLAGLAAGGAAGGPGATIASVIGAGGRGTGEHRVARAREERAADAAYEEARQRGTLAAGQMGLTMMGQQQQGALTRAQMAQSATQHAAEIGLRREDLAQRGTQHAAELGLRGRELAQRGGQHMAEMRLRAAQLTSQEAHQTQQEQFTAYQAHLNRIVAEARLEEASARARAAGGGGRAGGHLGPEARQAVLDSMRGRYEARALAEARQTYGRDWPIVSGTPAGRDAMNRIIMRMLTEDPEGLRLFNQNVDALSQRNPPGVNPTPFGDD